MEEEFRKHIGFELRLIHNMLESYMKESDPGREFAITQLQRWIIRDLRHNSGRDMFQKDIEEDFKSSRATISNTISTMEKNGLVLRMPVEQDARLKKLVLTEKAIAFDDRCRENIDRVESRMCEGMSEEERGTLFRLLEKVRGNLDLVRKERKEI